MVDDPMTGRVAPPLCLPDATGREVCLAEFAQQWVVLYFYPKDGTMGCTREAREFSAALDQFQALGSRVIGVSPDTPDRHLAFIRKEGLKVLLLADPTHETLQEYGVWAKKKQYGREYMGVVRSTFLIGPDGRIRAVWRGVMVAGHVDVVQERLAALIGAASQGGL